VASQEGDLTMNVNDIIVVVDSSNADCKIRTHPHSRLIHAVHSHGKECLAEVILASSLPDDSLVHLWVSFRVERLH